MGDVHNLMFLGNWFMELWCMYGRQLYLMPLWLYPVQLLLPRGIVVCVDNLDRRMGAWRHRYSKNLFLMPRSAFSNNDICYKILPSSILAVIHLPEVRCNKGILAYTLSPGHYQYDDYDEYLFLIIFWGAFIPTINSYPSNDVLRCASMINRLEALL